MRLLTLVAAVFFCAPAADAKETSKAAAISAHLEGLRAAGPMFDIGEARITQLPAAAARGPLNPELPILECDMQSCACDEAGAGKSCAFSHPGFVDTLAAAVGGRLTALRESAIGLHLPAATPKASYRMVLAAAARTAKVTHLVYRDAGGDLPAWPKVAPDLRQAIDNLAREPVVGARRKIALALANDRLARASGCEAVANLVSLASLTTGEAKLDSVLGELAGKDVPAKLEKCGLSSDEIIVLLRLQISLNATRGVALRSVRMAIGKSGVPATDKTWGDFAAKVAASKSDPVAVTLGK